MSMETNDLLLKKATPEDWEAMYRNVWSRPEAARYMQWQITTSAVDAQARMARTIAWQTNHDTYLVYEKSSGQHSFPGFKNVGRGFPDAPAAAGRMPHQVLVNSYHPLQGASRMPRPTRAVRFPTSDRKFFTHLPRACKPRGQEDCILYRTLGKYRKNPEGEALQVLRTMLDRTYQFSAFTRTYVRSHLDDYPGLAREVTL